MKSITLSITSAHRNTSTQFSALLCETEAEKQKGLMGVSGRVPIMVFQFSMGHNHMWMKNTPEPLDIVFCLRGEIVDVKHGRPNDEALIGGKMCDMVVEFPAGFCHALKIKNGDRIEK